MLLNKTPIVSQSRSCGKILCGKSNLRKKGFSPAYLASAQPLVPKEVKVAEVTVDGDRVTCVRKQRARSARRAQLLSDQGTALATVGKSSHLSQCHGGNFPPPQTCPEAHLPGDQILQVDSSHQPSHHVIFVSTLGYLSLLESTPFI